MREIQEISELMDMQKEAFAKITESANVIADTQLKINAYFDGEFKTFDEMEAARITLASIHPVVKKIDLGELLTESIRLSAELLTNINAVYRFGQNNKISEISEWASSTSREVRDETKMVQESVEQLIETRKNVLKYTQRARENINNPRLNMI